MSDIDLGALNAAIFNRLNSPKLRPPIINPAFLPKPTVAPPATPPIATMPAISSAVVSLGLPSIPLTTSLTDPTVLMSTASSLPLAPSPVTSLLNPVPDGKYKVINFVYYF